MLKKFLPALTANLAAALSEILLMASAAWLIVTASFQPPLSALSVGITLVRTAGISRAVLRYVDRFLTHKIIFKFLDDLREKLFKSATLAKKISSGEMLHDLTVTADLLKDFLPRVVLPISTAALVTILLTYFLTAPLQFYAMILPAIFLTVIIFSAKFEIGTADDSTYRAKLLDFNLNDELKIFGVKPALKILNRTAESFGDSQLQIQMRQLKFDTFIKIYTAAGLCFILWQLGAVVGKVELTVWALIFFAVQEIFSAVTVAVQTYKKIRHVKFSDSNTKIAETSTNFAVEFRNVNFGYDFPVIKNFNLQIERGEKVLIAGESGAGKTTLLYLMTKILQPDGGEILTSGKFAAATSTNYIFSQSIRFNFEIYCENISDTEILNCLKICQLENFDIDTEIGEDAAKLSGGERGRLQIALALAKNPDVLILDEPTAGLDKNISENLIAALVEDCNKKNRTLIIITHDLNFDWRKISL